MRKFKYHEDDSHVIPEDIENMSDEELKAEIVRLEAESLEKKQQNRK